MKMLLAFGMLLAAIPVRAAESAVGVMLAEVTGSVWTRPAPSAPWEAAKSADMLAPGAEVRTGRGAEAVLSFSDGNKVKLTGATIFGVEDATTRQTALRLVSGKIQAWVRRVNNADFTVRHSAGVAAVRGTIFGMEGTADGGLKIDLFEGSLDVVDNFGRPATMNPGQNAQLTQQGGMQGVNPMPPAERKPPVEPKVETPPAPKTAAANAPSTRRGPEVLKEGDPKLARERKEGLPPPKDGMKPPREGELRDPSLTQPSLTDRRMVDPNITPDGILRDPALYKDPAILDQSTVIFNPIQERQQTLPCDKTVSPSAPGCP